MDNVHCNIIQDLLPLYADDVVSPQSRAMVSSHLANCPRCRDILAEIKNALPLVQNSDTQILKKMRRKQRAKSLLSSSLLLLWVYAILISPIAECIRDYHTSYGATDCIVSTTEEGLPVITLSEKAKGGNIFYLYDVDEMGNTEVYLCIDSNIRPFFYVFLSQLFRLDFSEGGTVSVTLGVASPRDHYSNYPGVRELLFDSSVTAIYYQPITYDQQRDFYSNYLYGSPVNSLEDYIVPASSQRVLLWSRNS